MASNKRLLALDQSSRITGWAVFEDKKLLNYGKFTITDDRGEVRLYKIRQKVKELIETYNINEVVMEDIQLQESKINNIATFKILAQVLGVIQELLVELDIPQAAVVSSSWKSTLGIKGRTRPDQKRNAAAWVQQTYGIEPSQDTVDAICIGEHYLKKKVSEECAW